VATVVSALIANAVTTGFVFRQRSMVEPLVLLLALAGAASWRMTGGFAAAALAVVAVVAGIQSRAPVAPVVIAATAGAVFLATRRLPSRPFEALPDSPMVASFRRGFESKVPGGFSRSPLFVDLGGLLRTFRAAFVARRVAVMRAAPLLDACSEEVGPATRGQRSLQGIVHALGRFAPASEPPPTRAFPDTLHSVRRLAPPTEPPPTRANAGSPEMLRRFRRRRATELPPTEAPAPPAIEAPRSSPTNEGS
jgi:hypothetical protein